MMNMLPYFIDSAQDFRARFWIPAGTPPDPAIARIAGLAAASSLDLRVTNSVCAR